MANPPGQQRSKKTEAVQRLSGDFEDRTSSLPLSRYVSSLQPITEQVIESVSRPFLITGHCIDETTRFSWM